MWYWPSCVLTDYERKFVSLYKDGKKPGVLRRMYPLQLANQAQPDQNIPAVSTIAKIQIARRSRVFAITFGGNLDAWRLTVKNSNGTVYTNPTPRTNKPPIVTSLIAGNIHSVSAFGIDPASTANGTIGVPFNAGTNDETYITKSYGSALGPVDANSAPSAVAQSRMNFPWLIEPNWILQPNETIIFEGLDASPLYTYNDGTNDIQVRLRQILNICFFAWEFPGMGR
jgi:hypothetical protein